MVQAELSRASLLFSVSVDRHIRHDRQWLVLEVQAHTRLAATNLFGVFVWAAQYYWHWLVVYFTLTKSICLLLVLMRQADIFKNLFKSSCEWKVCIIWLMICTFSFELIDLNLMKLEWKKFNSWVKSSVNDYKYFIHYNQLNYE